MEAVADKMQYTADEYLTFCESHEGRFEFVNGEIIEMSGESVTANQIAGNIHFYLRQHLQDKEYLFVQNAVKLRMQEGAIFRIPDFMIFPETGNHIRYATDPILIVEVISESTEKIDRISKLNEYSQIASLEYYLIIEQTSRLAAVYAKDADRWYVAFYDKAEQIIPLPALGAELPMEVIYKKVKLGE